MSSGRNRGLVQTVLGTVHPSELGAATTHEHLYIDFSFMYRPAQDTPSPELADAPITLENLGWIRRKLLQQPRQPDADGPGYDHR